LPPTVGAKNSHRDFNILAGLSTLTHTCAESSKNETCEWVR
jgi:hypothetical protein